MALLPLRSRQLPLPCLITRCTSLYLPPVYPPDVLDTFLTLAEVVSACDSLCALQVIPNFRVRTIPVLGTSPAVFGMAAASWILCKLGKQPYLPEPVFQMRRGQYETILETLHDDDMKLLGHCDDIHVDLEEVCSSLSEHTIIHFSYTVRSSHSLHSVAA